MEHLSSARTAKVQWARWITLMKTVTALNSQGELSHRSERCQVNLKMLGSNPNNHPTPNNPAGFPQCPIMGLMFHFTAMWVELLVKGQTTILRKSLPPLPPLSHALNVGAPLQWNVLPSMKVFVQRLTTRGKCLTPPRWGHKVLRWASITGEAWASQVHPNPRATGKRTMVSKMYWSTCQALGS